MSRRFVAIAALALGGCGQNDDPAGADDLYARVTSGAGFRSWRRAPAFPERRPSFTSHSDAVDVFVDPNMSAALDGPDIVRSWPAGSIVVKESFSSDTTTLIAAMEKKPDGSWFWAEWDASGKVLFSGKPKVCVECHDNRARYSDWVYSIEFPK
ncbi:MAG: cytochrome P460 family protein [Labilithrix sp.]|nr:cytochrome P460 family protein [Labilithrix sp.]MCW5816707.1 cytochrome P460 family protein [Labilithrix sp.]